MNPEVPWRMGERYLTTDFIQNKNVAIRDAARDICQTETVEPDALFEGLAKWIRDGFKYPLNAADQPAADGLFRYGTESMCKYHYQKQVPYMWLLPNEVINAKHGICIDTANLAVSVGVALDLPAWVVLGEVRSVSVGKLLGYHAWYESEYKDETHIIETTIHEAGVNNIVLSCAVYDPKSEWAKKRDIYYVPQAHFNHLDYFEDGPMAARMPMLLGLPFRRAELFGTQPTFAEARRKPAQIYRDWAKEENYLRKLLEEAYRKL